MAFKQLDENKYQKNQGKGTPENHIIGKLDTDRILPLHIRRGELLEKVKAQSVARGGSASQVVCYLNILLFHQMINYLEILLFRF